MQPISVYRNWQLDKLRKAPTVLDQLLLNVSQKDATIFRDGSDGWTVLEVMCHLRDYELVFIERARLSLSEDNPPLPNPDPAQMATERKYNSGSIQEAFEAWKASRNDYLDLLMSVEDEDTWERPAQHPRRGPFTLNDQVHLAAWHDVNHFDQIAKILRDKMK